MEKFQNEQKFSRNLNLGSFRQRSQDSKRLKKTDNSDPHRSRRNSFTEIQDRKRDRTPQRCRQTRSFRREGGARLTGLETYQGLPQPEPPSLPITGIGSESNLLEPDGLSLSYSRYGTDLLFRYFSILLLNVTLCMSLIFIFTYLKFQKIDFIDSVILSNKHSVPYHIDHLQALTPKYAHNDRNKHKIIENSGIF